MYAEVAVNAAAPVRQTFTYRIPQGMSIQAGHAVYVPWGRRTLQGIVCEVTETPAYAEARDIEGVIDDLPLLSPEHVALALWMSGYYLAPLFDCLSLCLPAGFKRRPLTYLQVAFWVDGDEECSEAEREIVGAIKEAGEIEQGALKRMLKAPGAARALAALVKRGVLARSYRLSRPSVTPRKVKMARLAVDEQAAQSEAQRLRGEGTAAALRRAAIVEGLIRDGPMTLSQARELGLTPAVRRDLADILTIEEETVVRDPLAGRSYPHREPARLTEDQEAATREIAAIIDGIEETAAFLLHGVTGSGKTEVYLAAVAHALSSGKRAIVLVPEIALTPQTIRRFAERFPGDVAVLHSNLSPGEQHDVWHEIKSGRYKIAVGPRGALFAPMPDLGLVIIDEEHEWTYKQQDASPRYHARRAAEELCRLSGATLVLGSATPDVESHFRAMEGPLQLLSLPKRLVRSREGVTPGPLPSVEVVDLREELKAGNRSIFSRSLAAGIQSALDSSEQVILFLNRRGTASFLQCRDCGHSPECRSCAVALTYHEPEPRLVCHYCNRRYPVTGVCPACGGNRLRQVGLGTERVEEEVHARFPGARTARWDRDMTRGRDAHEAILARFLAHEADVLIGTQMVAKGLDMPMVTLVGVISADIALRLPDIRAGERTFQLLEQVAGRAGRGDRPGRVVVQTYSPDHYAIEAAGAHDYDGLYASEIEFRRRLGYPPFGRLVRLAFAHTGREYAQQESARMAHHLRSERDRRGLPNLDILGPAPALIPRIRRRWRWNVLLRGSDPSALVEGQALHRGWTVDIDPISIL